MEIRTIESDFEYNMKQIVKKFRRDWELEDLNAEDFQEKVWKDKNLAAEFGKAVIEHMGEFSGDELFENDND